MTSDKVQQQTTGASNVQTWGRKMSKLSVTILPVFGGKCDSESPQATMAASGREYVSPVTHRILRPLVTRNFGVLRQQKTFTRLLPGFRRPSRSLAGNVIQKTLWAPPKSNHGGLRPRICVPCDTRNLKKALKKTNLDI